MQEKETTIQDNEKQHKELEGNKCLLTVVVPSYNASATLDRTVQSFLKSKYVDDDIFEVLLVDDGSTDNITGRMIDQYASAHPSVLRAIHKENGGHGSCINTGIHEARGEYLKVVDADDWVEPEEFDKLLQALNQQHTDIVASQYMWAFEEPSSDKAKINIEKEKVNTEKSKGNIDKIKDSADKTKSSTEKTKGIIDMPKGNTVDAEKNFRYQKEFSEPFKGVEYGKTYTWKDIPTTTYIKMHAMTIRTSILREHHIHIDEHSFYVDTEFILFPVPYVKTISFTDANVYRYRIGRKVQSMSPEKMRKNAEQYAHVMRSLLSFYKHISLLDSHRMPINEVTSNDNQDMVVTSSQVIKEADPDYLPYLEHAIARIYAGWVKILLSFPTSRETKQRLIESEKKLQKEAPAVYNANINRAVTALRASHYLLHRPAAALLRRKNKA